MFMYCMRLTVSLLRITTSYLTIYTPMSSKMPYVPWPYAQAGSIIMFYGFSPADFLFIHQFLSLSSAI